MDKCEASKNKEFGWTQCTASFAADNLQPDAVLHQPSIHLQDLHNELVDETADKLTKGCHQPQNLFECCNSQHAGFFSSVCKSSSLTVNTATDSHCLGVTNQ